jgi:hypothetical protein
MSVADLRDRVDQGEWLAWYVFYGRKAQREELERLKAG